MDPNEDPEELVLRVHFYGIRSSGGLCMAAVKQLIEMAKRENLQKVAQVLESAYVDDCNSSVGNLEDLEEIKQMMPDFMANHGMAFKALSWTGEEAPKELLEGDWHWETGTVLMKYRILQRKLIFLHHLSTLPDSSLAKEVYTLQKQINLPRLLTECEEFLHNYELYDIESYSKAQGQI